jgi:hypothetical protein
MRMFLAVSTAGLLAMFLAAPLAQAQDAMANAKAALESCMATFPDGKKTLKSFEKLGMVPQPEQSGIQLFLDATGTVAAGTSTDKAIPLRCMVTLGGVDPAQAKAMAEAFLPSIADAKDLGVTTDGVAGYWVGTLNGKPVGLLVTDAMGFGSITGPTIVLNAN